MSLTSYPEMKPYLDMKPSGIDWLGDIPEHWKIPCVWMLFSLGRGRVINHLEIQDNVGIYPVYSSQTEDDGVMGSIDTYAFEGQYLTWTTDGAKAGTVFYREGKFNCTNVCGTMKPKKEVVLKYFAYVLNFATQGYIRYDINPKLMNDVMARIPIPVPPPDEQKAIADYLDLKTSQIDGVIREKEEQIRLLTEQRQAVISHAVTRGLDPNAPMKSSGIAWLGDVPVHWEVKRLKYLCSFTGGGTPSKGNDEFWKGDIPWVSPKDMKVEYISETEDYITEEAIIESSTALIAPGAVLIVVRSGILKHTIPVAINLVPVTLNQDMKALAFRKMNPKYFALYVRGLQHILLTAWRKEGATVESLEHEYLANYEMTVPPLSEQEAIIGYLDTETSRLDNVIKTLTLQIEELREYRQALISAVVTGKLQVDALTPRPPLPAAR